MSSTSLSLRMDIDTVECVRGMPELLSIANERGVEFTFYANLGRSVSRVGSLRGLMQSGDSRPEAPVQKLSSFEKLSFSSLIDTLVFNPGLSNRYSSNWIALRDSTHEVGLHGGRNHAEWQRHALDWPYAKLEGEIVWGVSAFQSVFQCKPASFASPGWTSPPALKEILGAHGFVYFADDNRVGVGSNTNSSNDIQSVNTNILGEPGHVGFFEHCFARGLSQDDMLTEFDRLTLIGQHNILYDHPGFVSRHGSAYLVALIDHALDKGISVKTISEALL